MQEAGAPFAAVIVQLSELGAIAIGLLSISARDEKPIVTDAVDVWAAPNIVTEKFEVVQLCGRGRRFPSQPPPVKSLARRLRRSVPR